MPVDHRLRLNDNQSRVPIVPDSRQPYPEQTVGIVDLGAFDAALLNCQLLTKGHVLKNQLPPALKHRSQESTNDRHTNWIFTALCGYRLSGADQKERNKKGMPFNFHIDEHYPSVDCPNCLRLERK